MHWALDCFASLATTGRGEMDQAIFPLPLAQTVQLPYRNPSVLCACNDSRHAGRASTRSMHAC